MENGKTEILYFTCKSKRKTQKLQFIKFIVPKSSSLRFFNYYPIATNVPPILLS